jgi:hypothetical protein
MPQIGADDRMNESLCVEVLYVSALEALKGINASLGICPRRTLAQEPEAVPFKI